MARISRKRNKARTAIEGHASKSAKEKQALTESKIPASQYEEAVAPSSPRSKFNSVLHKLGIQLAGRYHTGSQQLSIKYDVTSEVIGGGCSGDVLLARSKFDSSKHFAVKTIEFKTLSSIDDWQLLETELEILFRADAVNVISACDVYETSSALHIVLPYMAGGQLVPAIGSEQEAVVMAFQMLSGLQYLHALGIVHRDVKPANCVWEKRGGNLKIIDFGLSAFWKPNDKKLWLLCGTPGYASPEMRTSKGYTNKTDMWSLGISIFKLLVGEMPFDLEGVPSQEDVDLRLACPSLGLSHLARHFLAYLLKVNPCARPTAEEALLHPWITGNSIHCDRSECSGPPYSEIYALESDEIDMLLKEWAFSLVRRAEDPPRSRWVDLFDDDDDE